MSETGLRVKFKATYEIVVATVAFLLAPHFSLGWFMKTSLSGPFFRVSFDAKWDGWMPNAGQRRVKSKKEK